MISIFVFLFIWIYALIGYFIPNNRHGSFNDNWYVEIQNGYMLEFIDDFENCFFIIIFLEYKIYFQKTLKYNKFV